MPSPTKKTEARRAAKNEKKIKNRQKKVRRAEAKKTAK
jgi:hypothetical protein